jgi:hypothetical protein
MKRLAFTLCLPLFLAACIARSPEPEPVVEQPQPSQPVRAAAETDMRELSALLPEGHRAGAVVEVNGARIVAIEAESAVAETPYLVLDEAMTAGVCTIKETGAVDDNGQQVDGDVNTLLVSNTGDKPIFLMAGDLVLGGKQDRVLAESLVVDPGSKDMRIPVFCVEHGRWVTQSKDGVTAEKGFFRNAPEQGQVDVNVKARALATGSQGAVWDEVAENNSRLGVSAGSGTFRATYDDEKTKKQIEDAYAQAAKLIDDKVVGFAVVHDGEVAAMDVFDSSGLAEKLSEKLLRSYIITAIGNGYELPMDRKIARITVNLNVQDQPVAAVATQLAQTLGVPIEVSEHVTGNVTLNLSNQDGVAAINALADQANARAVIHGNGLTLMKYEQESAQADFNENGVQVRSGAAFARGRPATQTMGGREALVAEIAPRESAPNPRTVNSREYEKEALKYACEDKTTGKKVQTSYMRR